MKLNTYTLEYIVYLYKCVLDDVKYPAPAHDANTFELFGNAFAESEIQKDWAIAG